MASNTPNNSPSAYELAAKLVQARGGSAEKLGSLLEDCRRYLLLIANREMDNDLRAKASASDMVQDTFLAAQQEFRHFEGASRQELYAWLTQILHHRLQNHCRKFRHTKKRTVSRELRIDHDIGASVPDARTKETSPSAVATAFEEQVRLNNALNQLPEDYRRVILMRTMDKQSFKEIGKSLGRSSEAARKIWSRAIMKLGKCLNEIN